MPTLTDITLARYIFLVSTNLEFRKKYLGNFTQLNKDFKVSTTTAQQISRLDVKKIETQLTKAGKPIVSPHSTPGAAGTHDNCHTHGDGDPGHSNTHCNYNAPEIDVLVEKLGLAHKLSELTAKAASKPAGK
jgi:hypothetical protein